MPDLVVAQLGGASCRLDDLGRLLEWVPQVCAEVTSASQAEAAENAGACALLLRGNESRGWVSDESTFVLLQHVLGLGVKLPLWACGGVGLHSAAG